jgi:MFS transporter, PAT family, beta-lactamase induction signal transducer AmpG
MRLSKGAEPHMAEATVLSPEAAPMRPVHPAVFFCLNLPTGIVGGYLVAVFPFIATRAGMPVAVVASIIAAGLFPKTWKFLWSPVADLLFTLKIWYRVGAVLAGGMLIVQGAVLSLHGNAWFIAAAAFCAEFAASLITLALGGLMANSMPGPTKGRASGWYQAGGKFGHGAAGTGGIWFAAHGASPFAAVSALGLACVACLLVLALLSEPARTFDHQRLRDRSVSVAKDVMSIFRTLNGALLVPLVMLPIGISGVANFWSGVSSEWHVSPDTVAWVNGIGYSIVCAGGSIIGGRWADQMDRRFFFLGTGALVAVVGVALAVAPHTAAVFVLGVLGQELAIGMSDAAWSAVILNGIGRGAAATKWAVFSGLGNAPDLYMTVLSGWVHDRWDTQTMLTAESVISLACIGVMTVLILTLSGIAERRHRQLISSS